MKRLRVLVLMHSEFVPRTRSAGTPAEQIHEVKTEYDVVSTLRAAGHEVHPLGVQDELKPVRAKRSKASSRTSRSRCWRDIPAR